eukprot:351291-Chlamydomonas_euryale.AAC.6
MRWSTKSVDFLDGRATPLPPCRGFRRLRARCLLGMGVLAVNLCADVEHDRRCVLVYIRNGAHPTQVPPAVYLASADGEEHHSTWFRRSLM